MPQQHIQQPGQGTTQRSIFTHPLVACIILVLLWALATLPGLNSVGLVNWQESARALVAQRMHESGDLLVPTIADQPYLAKPPMLYWAELVLCKITGRTPGEAELRWTVALAGLLGILLTYFAARSLLAIGIDRSSAQRGAMDPHEIDHLAALWAGAFLATGVLYVRSSRIGELDIFLAPWTVGAVWACGWLWIQTDAKKGHRMVVSLLGGISCVGAALTKGPPALISIALAVVGGITLWHAWNQAQRPRPAFTLWVSIAGAIVLAAACAVFNREQIAEPRAWLGILLFGLCGSALGLFAPLFISPGVFPRIITDVVRSGVIVAILLGLGGLWMWSSAVEKRLGSDVIARTIGQETSDNLRPLSFESPIQNLEAVSYAVGIGSIACIAAFIWLITQPPRISRSWLMLIAWLALGLVVFSLGGRGTGRYLTPLWPAVALLGGIWISRAVRDLPKGMRLAQLAALAVILTGGIQAYWYAVQAPAKEANRSARDLMHELLDAKHGVDPTRLAAIDFWVGSLDFYAQHHVLPIIDIGPWIDFPHEETALDDFIATMKSNGGQWTILIRATPSNDPLRPAQDVGMTPPEHFAQMLALHGFKLNEISLTSEFKLDRRKTRVVAYRIIPAP
jgi:4-amino-4-deoxy-L-arabinose transferase-like glycosyltransferase